MTELKKEISDCLDWSLSRFSTIWDEIGITNESRMARRGIVLHHVRALLQEMVQEEEATKKRLMDNIDNYRVTVAKLSEELDILEYKEDSSQTALQREKQLRFHVDELTKTKEERLKKLKELSSIDQKLCDTLCATPYYIPSGVVPTVGQLSELEDHVKKMTIEKENRLTVFKDTKEKIKKLFDELEEVPDTSFENDIMSEEDESFQLSPENMKLLKKVHDELEVKLQTNVQLAEQLRERIRMMWNRLAIKEDDMKDFMARHSGSKAGSIRAMQQELARCRELKIQNMRQVIESTRDDIRQLWDKCYFSQQQRDAFLRAYSSNDYTEELLEQHDNEVQILQDYYQRHRLIFDRVRQREELWTKFLNFEQMASDPNRLFLNRGCNLLKEEKARNHLMKQLPQVEQEVEQDIVHWEQTTGNKFLMYGTTYSDYIRTQWNEYKMRKDAEKQQRHEQKNKKLEEEMMYGSRPATTPSKKRLAPITPSKSSNKLRKVNEPVNSTTKTLHNPTSLFAHYSTPHSQQRKDMPKAVAGGGASDLASKVQPLVDSQGVNRPTAVLPSTYSTQPSTGLAAVIPDSTIVSSGVISGSSSSDPDSTLPPIGHYQEFAGALNENVRTNCRSSVIPKPAYF